MIRLVLTQGDLHGCGPELCAAALQAYAAHPTIQLTVLGDPSITAPRRDVSAANAGARSAQCVRDAAALVLSGHADAMVTAPINKLRWDAAGITVPGHTELLAQCVDPLSPPPTTMLFWSPSLRVTLVTLHVPLAEVSRRLTGPGIIRAVQQTHDFLSRVLHRSPRLACLGLNPHAGEQGLLGHEDGQIIAPALAECRAAQIAIDGPFPADTFFAHRRGDYDAVVAMYHDQGLIPIKTLAPDTAVNITLGLPFLRVSPGHGTAEDRAGTGTVRPDNFFAAIDTAAYLVEQTRTPTS